MLDARSAGLNSLEAYCILSDPNYQVEWFHREILHALQRASTGEIDRIMISMPPRHGKSRSCSIDFPTWMMGKFPNCQTIVSGYSTEFTQTFSKDAREKCRTSEFTNIFGFGLKKDEQGVGEWKLENGSSYRAVGVTASLTGMGANILVIDDPHKDREEADSQRQRDKIWNWYTSTASSRLQPFDNGMKPIVVVIMTRWHEDDLCGRLLEMEKKGGDKWHNIVFPVLNDKGVPLWEKRIGLDALGIIRKNSEREWNSLWMQNPLPEKGQYFDKSWFTYYDKLDFLERKNDFFIVGACDPAISDKEQADFCSITILARTSKTPHIYVIEQFEKKGISDSEKCNVIFRMYDKYKFTRFGVEVRGYQKAFYDLLRNEMKLRKKWFTLEPLLPKGSKDVRIRTTLEPLYSNGLINHNKQNCQELESQLLKFPSGKHDDCPDSLEMAVGLIDMTPAYETDVVVESYEDMDFF